jgi:hypothetical protein
MTSIRKVFGSAVTKVWRREVGQPDRGNPRGTLEKRPRDSVHPVHDPAVWAENDRIGPIDVSNQLHVLDDGANRGLPSPIIEPVVRVHLANRRQLHVLDGKAAAQLEQFVDIPSVQT